MGQRGAGMKGRWIKDELLHPTTNIMGRLYRTKDGFEATFRGTPWATADGRRPEIDAWFFPETDEGAA